MRWADILRVDKDAVTPQGAVAMTRWLRRQFAENRPYDAMARDILTAQGRTAAEGPAAFYKVLDTPEVMGRSFSQVFLGVRIECAQCHHHPSEQVGPGRLLRPGRLLHRRRPQDAARRSEAIVAQGGADLEPSAHRQTGPRPAARRRRRCRWPTSPTGARCWPTG